ncbi:DUF2281 domain-containing protein [Phormidesmis sp. 146-35]
MPSKQQLLDEIEQIPDFLVEEILDFVQFLKSKHQPDRQETALLSESTLAKDWLRPEEDEAWQDL